MSEPVTRYTVQPTYDWGIGEIKDYAGRYVHFADYDRDIRALENHIANHYTAAATAYIKELEAKTIEQAKTISQLEGETVTLTKQRDAQRVLCTAGIKQQGIMRERIDHLEDEIYAALKATP